MSKKGKTTKHTKHTKHMKTAKKHKGVKHSMTIPQLRLGLHSISSISDTLCTSKMPHEKKVKMFQDEWYKVFGRKVHTKVASDYIRHLERSKKSVQKTKKMRGGAAITGAPVDHMMRPGAGLPNGNFLEYVKSGFDVGVPVPGMASSCGVQGGTVPYPDTGSNRFSQSGGGISDAIGGMFGSVGTAFSALSFRPYTAENPSTTMMNAGSVIKGQSTGPGPESWQQTWSPRMSPGPNPVVPMAQALQRYLPTDVKLPT